MKVPSSFADSIARYHELVSTWNNYSSLMSSTELKNSFPEHIADSLALSPYILQEVGNGRIYVDIGGGGGLPAVPIAIILQSTRVLLVERNERKAIFLRKVVAVLKLKNVNIVNASFPTDVEIPQPFVLTARAIEKPSVFVASLAQLMEDESCFLRQTGQLASALPEGLRSSRIEDVFDHEGIRKGLLFRVTKD